MRTDAFAAGANARQNLATPAKTRGIHWMPLVLCLQVNSDVDFLLANLDAPRRNTSPLVKQGLASDRDLPGLQSHVCKRAYVRKTLAIIALIFNNRINYFPYIACERSFG